MLEVKNLTISFKLENSQAEVIRKIDFSLQKNEILGIVGESGSGKSVTSLAILGLLPKNKTEINGSILFQEDELLNRSEKDFQKIRGNKISMIFQEPMSSLNPSLTCGFQVIEMILQHQQISKKEAKKHNPQIFHNNPLSIALI